MTPPADDSRRDRDVGTLLRDIGLDRCKVRKVSAQLHGARVGFHQHQLRIERIAACDMGAQAA